MKTILAALIATSFLAGVTTSAKAADDAPITVASLDSATAKTSSLQILSKGGAKSKALRRDISQSPIPREVVAFTEAAAPGTIIVDNSERRLYHVLGGGVAVKYAVSVGRSGFLWTGTNTVSRKAEWPGWTPPAEMRKRVPDLPAYMPGGPDNPLGARALYIGATLYRLHGTSEPWTIGQAVSSGCIRLTNEDIIDLYDRTKVGALVVVHQ